MDGVLNVHKPSGITSYDVIRHIKRVMSNERRVLSANERENKLSTNSVLITRYSSLKIGHAGTLDPFASGVLLILLGKATKLASQFLKCEKTYQGAIFLGIQTDTGDITGNVIREYLVSQELDLSCLRRAAEAFEGEIEQTPPMYSALHHEGTRLYKLARKNIVVERKSRRVLIKEFEILDFQFPRVFFEVRVSGGTYVRVLAEDFARSLNTVGFLERLCRTAIGDFSLAESAKLEDLNTLEDLERMVRV